jgi:hypothetical protein
LWEKLQGDGPELALTAISTSASICRVLTGTLIVDSYRNGISGSYPGSLSVNSGPSPLMGRASETLHSMAPHGVPTTTAIASGYFTMTELVLEA